MSARRIPAAEWQAAKNRQTPAERDKLARWLGVDPDAHGAFYALLPFARIETDEGPSLGAIFEPPLVFFHWPMVMKYTGGTFVDGVHVRGPGKLCPDELPDHIWERLGRGGEHSDVLLCDRNSLHRVRNSSLILPDNCEGAVKLFTCSKSFARAWAQNRMAFVERHRVAKEQYLLEIMEPMDGGLPGALIVGKPDRIRWPAGVNFTAPDEATAKVVNIAIWKAAQLSRATVATDMKATG